MWIKVCANTSLEDALLAARAGANAVGFVFAKSVRRVTPAQVRLITPHLPAEIEKIGVFVDASLNELIAAVQDCGLTGVQLYSGCESDAAPRLHERFSSLRILKVVHFQQGLDVELRIARADRAIDAVLVDSRTAKLLGGTGVPFDWKAAQGKVDGSKLRIIVAGGLNPENVGEAIKVLKPWGVDVASGVETSPGKKDPDKVRIFIENARTAALRLGAAAQVRA